MKITVLVENTSTSSEFGCKHGLSFYIETAKHRVLFDVGPDSLFLQNAQKLKIDISKVDIVVISHGHSDHGGGLKFFLEHNTSAKVYVRESAFNSYFSKTLFLQIPIGLDTSLRSSPQLVFTKEHTVIDEELQLFSGVTDRDCFSSCNKTLYMKTAQGLEHDAFIHEQSLIVRENGTQVLFGGCAHCGILNIQKCAQELPDVQLSAVISGFHLFNPTTKRSENPVVITEIAKKLAGNGIRYYTCHCTGKTAYSQLESLMGNQICYLSAGSTLELSGENLRQPQHEA